MFMSVLSGALPCTTAPHALSHEAYRARKSFVPNGAHVQANGGPEHAHKILDGGLRATDANDDNIFADKLMTRTR